MPQSNIRIRQSLTPLFVSRVEGWHWIRWEVWRKSPDPRMHAVMWMDGSVSDEINGWRTYVEYDFEELTKLICNITTWEDYDDAAT